MEISFLLPIGNQFTNYTTLQLLMTQPKGNRVAIDFNHEFHFAASVRIIRPQKSRIDLVEYFNWILSQIFPVYLSLDNFSSIFMKNNTYKCTYTFFLK